MPTDDDGSQTREAVPPSPDPHGQAALLLVESLIHGLCEKSMLSTEEAIEIAERAVDVQCDLAEAADGARAPMWGSQGLLSCLARWREADGHDAPPPPRLVP